MPISKQLALQRHYQKLGLCRACGEERCPESSALCAKHLLKNRLYRRARFGYKKKTKLGRGRPCIILAGI